MSGRSAAQLWDLETVRTFAEEHGRYQHEPKTYVSPWKGSFECLDNCQSKGGLAYTDLKPKTPKESLWINGCHNSSWFAEELTRRELAEIEVSWDNKTKLSNDKIPHFIDKPTTFVTLLKTCAKTKDLSRGSILHDDIEKRGFLTQCLDALVIMYAKCGAFKKAEELLDIHKSQSVVTWTALISEYVQQGHGEQALKCFEQMQRNGLCPDGVTFVSILKACGDLGARDKGAQIHDEIASKGLLGNDVLGTALVGMYAKCGAFTKAAQVFEKLPSRSVITWNALISVYAQQGQGDQALHCFQQMQQDNVSPNAVTLACVLKACGSIRAIDKGEKLHDEITKQGLLENNVVLATALVDMYAKCGALGKAEQVFEECPSWDVITWNALIAGYVQQDQGEQALSCFERMLCEGFSPDSTTFTCILKACGILKTADKGEQIHDEIARQGLLGKNVVLGSAIVDMYAKCGSLKKAQEVLEGLTFRDIITWNALIVGYSQHDQGEQALACYERMQHEGLFPNAVTFSCILKACGSLGTLAKGEQIHDEIARQGLLENNMVLSTALVDMYAKCNALEKAEQMLEQLSSRDVSTWNALITGYVQGGQGEQALNCFERMKGEGISPDAVTFSCILKACGSIGAADKGEQICDEIAGKGLLKNNTILGTAVVDMYGKCGAVAKAARVLDELPSRDVTSWSALIAGYAKHGQSDQALYCLERMQHEGVSPNAVTLSCVLNACSHLGLVNDGHMYFSNMSTQYGVKQDFEHYAGMVDLFGRAGHLDKAVGLIQEMPLSDYSGALSALLGACHKWGDVDVGRWAFEQAVQAGRSDAAAYVLMANLYATAGKQEDSKVIESMSLENKAWKCAAG